MRRASVRTTRLRFVARSGEEVSLAADVAIPGGGARPSAVAVYVPGYGSVRDGEKAVAFRDAFLRAGIAFVAFEPRGHGDSSGSLADLTLGRHREDLDAVLAFARGIAPRLAGIGSSLGGLVVALHAATHPRAFRSIALIAPAFGFHARWSRVPRKDWPPGLTAEALASMRAASTPRIAGALRTPALVWHGMQDDAVPWRESVRFAERSHAAVEVRLLARGDHRLTRWCAELAEAAVAHACAAGLLGASAVTKRGSSSATSSSRGRRRASARRRSR